MASGGNQNKKITWRELIEQQLEPQTPLNANEGELNSFEELKRDYELFKLHQQEEQLTRDIESHGEEIKRHQNEIDRITMLRADVRSKLNSKMISYREDQMRGVRDAAAGQSQQLSANRALLDPAPPVSGPSDTPLIPQSVERARQFVRRSMANATAVPTSCLDFEDFVVLMNRLDDLHVQGIDPYGDTGISEAAVNSQHIGTRARTAAEVDEASGGNPTGVAPEVVLISDSSDEEDSETSTEAENEPFFGELYDGTVKQFFGDYVFNLHASRVEKVGLKFKCKDCPEEPLYIARDILEHRASKHSLAQMTIPATTHQLAEIAGHFFYYKFEKYNYYYCPLSDCEFTVKALPGMASRKASIASVSHLNKKMKHNKESIMEIFNAYLDCKTNVAK